MPPRRHAVSEMGRQVVKVSSVTAVLTHVNSTAHPPGISLPEGPEYLLGLIACERQAVVSSLLQGNKSLRGKMATLGKTYHNFKVCPNPLSALYTQVGFLVAGMHREV